MSLSPTPQKIEALTHRLGRRIAKVAADVVRNEGTMIPNEDMLELARMLRGVQVLPRRNRAQTDQAQAAGPDPNGRRRRDPAAEASCAP